MILAEKITLPEMIEKLPDIDISIPGVKGKLFQGPEMQVVFFSIDNAGEIPPHHHQAQWGVILEGEAEMTINGQTRTMRRGDTYYIPAGVVHSIRILTPMKALDFFDEPSRYRPKP